MNMTLHAMNNVVNVLMRVRWVDSITYLIWEIWYIYTYYLKFNRPEFPNMSFEHKKNELLLSIIVSYLLIS